MNVFTWKPLFIELGQRLLAFRNQQLTVLSWLREMEAEGCNVISLEDESPVGTKIPLAEIDPFTIFACFNRNITDSNRLAVLSELKKRFDLAAPLPKDFWGIPILNSQKAWPFSYAYDRDPTDIPALWDWAEQIVNREPGALAPEAFARCVSIKQNGVAKLTMGMFWMQPDSYVAADGVNLDYLSKHGIDVAGMTCEQLGPYLRAVADIKARLDTDPARISLAAYAASYDLPAPVTPAVVDNGFAQLLARAAAENRCTIEQLIKWIRDADMYKGFNEVSSRLAVYPKLAAVLGGQAPSADELSALCKSEIWALSQQQDQMRLPSFLKHPDCIPAIQELLTEADDVLLLPRIQHFVQRAHACGYAPASGKAELTIPAQFASVLLTAVHPDRYVDYKQERWNNFFAAVTGQDSKLCPSPAAGGHNLLRAGSFAAMLSRTPTFQKHFGDRNGLWIASGLAVLWKKEALNIENWFGLPHGEKAVPRTPEAEESMEPTNVILCGPPGTGKTYRSMRRAVELADGHAAATDDATVKRRFDELRGQSRIVFVTFHQSYSYEDFVEGIRPVIDGEGDAVRYECRDGVFKQLCTMAADDSAAAKTGVAIDPRSVSIWKMSLGNVHEPEDAQVYEQCIRNGVIALGYGRGLDFTECDTPEKVRELLQTQDWAQKNPAYHITSVDFLRNQMKVGDLVVVTEGNRKFRAIGRISGPYRCDPASTHAQLRPVEWLRVFKESQPKDRLLKSKNFSQQTLYWLNPEDIKVDALIEMIAPAKKPDSQRGFVLIIDEINRGNISKIFGELITLIEPDKRAGQPNQLSAMLPYSQEPFSVPANVHIVGTMNTADKSIALVDVALRRRFEFEELMPDFDDPSKCSGLSHAMRSVLNELNRRIHQRKDRDHQIGHAYFRTVHDAAGFNREFTRRIIPLLHEYFYGDWDGLRFVLGEAGASGQFLVPIPVNPGEPKPRHAWRWCFDAGVSREGFDALAILQHHYGAGKATANG